MKATALSSCSTLSLEHKTLSHNPSLKCIPWPDPSVLAEGSTPSLSQDSGQEQVLQLAIQRIRFNA
jgi:hypothetical protein